MQVRPLPPQYHSEIPESGSRGLTVNQESESSVVGSNPTLRVNTLVVGSSPTRGVDLSEVYDGDLA